MNEHVSSLYVRAHELLNLGMDGSPIYSDHFARLNRKFTSKRLICTTPWKATRRKRKPNFASPFSSLLDATFYDNGRKQQYIQRLLDRCLNVSLRASGFASESASSNLLLR